METLLKKGILGFLENGEENANETYFERNVDDIIQNNSRIAKYSLINGSCSFSKGRFVSDNADNMLKINDPNFWNIVLKNVQSPTQQLLKKIKNKEFPQSLDGQKQLMFEAS
jgi:chromodomain-helicase-DNA-binding protein 7